MGVAGATLVAVFIGVLGLLLPHQAAQLFGYQGTDALLYRLAGSPRENELGLRSSWPWVRLPLDRR